MPSSFSSSYRLYQSLNGDIYVLAMQLYVYNLAGTIAIFNSRCCSLI